MPTPVLRALNPSGATLVTDRRGSMVWDVTTDRGRYAVKTGYPIAATDHWPAQPWTALAPAREAFVLDQLGVHVDGGTWERGWWNAQVWHEGPDLQRLWAPYRKCVHGGGPGPAVGLECAQSVALLHAQGWAHGDLQPAHFLIGPDHTQLIDLALAHGKPVPPDVDFPFRGCLVHYEAPEISANVLNTGQAVPSPEADVYALGATFLMAATGWRAVMYPDDAPRPEQRRAIVEGNRRPVSMPGPMNSLVQDMLRYAPQDRPTSAEVVTVLAGFA
ncbi:protein kinase [Streptomyces sp. NPDC020607]|uniref:protein kinase domain-containing protein n=1 Tax=Streptomyces sp. NPDC020607 TaxID=3365082 RepID=UPI003794EFCC